MQLSSGHSLNNRKQRGFSLMEILITVIILSIGLLGLAGLQLTGLKYNQSAYLKSQATVYSMDILDRMRANRPGAETGGYNIAIGTTVTSGACSNCTPAEMATLDLSEWKQALQTSLPSGDGSVVQNGTMFTVTIQWDDSKGVNSPIQLPMETAL